MKMIVALLFTAFAMTAHAQGPGRNYVDNTGTVKARLAEKVVVINSASSTLNSGEAVCWDLTDDNGIAVDYCAAAGYKPACVIVDTTCAVGARCVCQTKGYMSFAEFAYISSTAATAGQVVYASVDGSVYAIGDGTAANHANKFPVGTALDAKSETGDLEIYIDL